METYLSTVEVAKMLGVSRITVTRWIDRGALKASVTLGGHRRISLKDLKEFAVDNKIDLQNEDAWKDGGKILIVDDEEEVIDALEMFIQHNFKRCTTQSARNGFDAGLIVQEFQPEVILLDLFMPGMDGFEVCRLVKEKYPHIKVIAMTGYGTEEIRERILAEGADIYLAKPFDFDLLIGQLKTLMSRA